MSNSENLSSPSREDDDTDADNSDDGLKIDIDTPPRKRCKLEIDETAKQIIETVAEKFEEAIEEKAAKTNLNVTNVKIMLRQVLTNEHVIAMLQNVDEENDTTVFEPKLTRAKAKELLSSAAPPVPVPLPAILPGPETSSETQLLVGEELQEDSSGDEYIPGEEESEDDPVPLPAILPGPEASSETQLLVSEELQEDSSGDEYIPGEESEDDRTSAVCSDTGPLSVSSVPPTTPTKDTLTEASCSWSNDGVFKVPSTKPSEVAEETNNIALRTRSKLSLSSTPLEVIEGSFIPPDITTDMYDMDCDDEDWADFLKTFTRPLDEVVKGPDDEDHDPEYNILADEAIDKKVDKEELREDKAVKVSKKELNALMTELFEYVDFYDTSALYAKDKQASVSGTEAEQPENEEENKSTSEPTSDETTETTTEPSVTFDPLQILLLKQQLAQHVQMLTQNFLLTYCHPNWYHSASTFKDLLLNIKYLSLTKEKSCLNTPNLDQALTIVDEWESIFSNKGGKEVIKYFQKTTEDAVKCKYNNVEYILTFPELILRTISNSAAFIYPHLLPRIPFHSPSMTSTYHTFTQSEVSLMAHGLEEFIPFLSKDKYYLNFDGKVKVKSAAYFVHKYVLGGVNDYMKVYKCIIKHRNRREPLNPINYYFTHKRAPLTTHYIVPVEQFGIVPPCLRQKHELPYQWRQYIYPDATSNEMSSNSKPIKTCKLVPAVIKKPLIRGKSNCKTKAKRLILPKPTPVEDTTAPAETNVDNVRWKDVRKKCKIQHKLHHKFVDIVKKRIALEKLISVTGKKWLNFEDQWLQSASVDTGKEDMLPGMPSLLSAAVQGCLYAENIEPNINGNCPSSSLTKPEESETAKSHSVDIPKDSQFISLPSTSKQNARDMMQIVDHKNGGHSKGNEKDNIEDINALMKASSTIKSARKEPSGTEKRRMRLGRQFICNLRIATPEEQSVIDTKNERFALAYYMKLQDTLEPADFRSAMEILTTVDESSTDAVDIYNSLIKILLPKYKDLADEFLLFLNDVQAHAIGKLVPYYMVKNMATFLQKVDIYFEDKPSHIKRIIKTLTDLGNIEDCTIEKVKDSILPLLKGNTYLTDLFLQNFITEHPPQSLIGDKFESIDIIKDTVIPDEEELYESIVLPEIEDKYGNNACVCSCHENKDDTEWGARKIHCIPCGTKYLQGHIFIQTGKELRPATVRFLTNTKKDHKSRLNGESSTHNKKRSDSTSKRSNSPLKECHDKSKVLKKREDEGGGKKKPPRARSPKKNPVKKAPKVDKSKSADQKTLTVTNKNLSPLICDNKADNLSVNNSNKSCKLKKSPKRTVNSRAVKPKRTTNKQVAVNKKICDAKNKKVCETEVMLVCKTEVNLVCETEDQTACESEDQKTCDSEDQMTCESEDQMTCESEDQKACIIENQQICETIHQQASESEDKHLCELEEISLNVTGAYPQKRPAEEPLDLDISSSVESVADLKLSSAESESEFCEESSQANTNSDSDDSSSSSVEFEEIEESAETSITDDLTWTREEDKIILETFQRESSKENVFEIISHCLDNRSVQQVRSRFHTLMSLIQKMTTGP